ncbi:MAG: Xaa-Pro peptidase family protein [Acidimicrobiia bacterium]|nr:Xaa-Pro peptidase family protein [Acidimicrobiia bacterium]
MVMHETAPPKQPKIARSLADASPEVHRAATDLHHLTLGPGPALENEWIAAGLELPDVEAMRRYRIDRVRAQMQAMGYDGALLMDPMNIRYATDSTNMQIWVMHNAARYCWVGMDGSCIVWEFNECEFLDAHNPVVTETRPATGTTYFQAGPRWAEMANRFADEIIDVVNEHAGSHAKIAVDQCNLTAYQRFVEAGIEVGSGTEMMELARVIKGPDEIKAMRCAIHACETTMQEMREAMKPGMTEREVWSILHAGNIRRAGEWIETQILASGPRTNPWMQEASSRIIEDRELLGYDTDLVGAYGMMVDISRTWLVGGGSPSATQASTHALALEQIQRNTEMLRPGTTLRQLTFDSWSPPVDDYRRYCCQFHGVGQCDEYPDVYWPEQWEDWGYDGVLEPGMVLTVESFVGPRVGGEGVKLENQVLVTESGPELLTNIPLSLV